MTHDKQVEGDDSDAEVHSAQTRRPSEQTRIPTLDGLRAAAVAFVIWGHLGRTPGVGEWYRVWEPVVPSAAFGVRVFFVISGFIITLLLLREWKRTASINMLSFYIRRAFRLLSALGAYLLFVVAADVWTDASEPWFGWVTSLTFTKNFYSRSWLTGHLWSLSVEEQFYLVWPAVVLVCPERWREVVAWAILPMAVGSRAFLLLTEHEGFAHVSPFTNFDFMMVGALLAFRIDRQDYSSVSPGTWRGILACGLLVLVALEVGVTNRHSLIWASVQPTLIALAIGVALASLIHIRGGPIFVLLNNPLVVYIGRISYSLYLWQQAFFVLEGYYGLDLPLILHFPGTIIGSFVAAILSYELVEQPAQRARGPLLRYLEARSKPAAVAEVAATK